jgi:pilus assembly protein Flp/PilA
MRLTVQPDRQFAQVNEREPAMKKLLRFLRAEDGPTAVEYAVMLALILLAVIAAVQAVGTSTSSSFSNSATSIGAAMGSS